MSEFKQVAPGELIDTIPEYHVYASGEPQAFRPGGGREWLAQIFALVPSLDPTPEFFANAAFEDNGVPLTRVLPLHKIAPDAALLFQVTAMGEADEQNRRALEATARNIGILANAWHNPEAFLELREKLEPTVV